jgi:hypothetical protein
VNGGFLLPTVIILGLGIGTVSVVAMQSVARNSVLLNDQYYSSVAQEAAQAGVNAAANCIRSGTQTWTDVNRLKPSTDCNGVTVTGKATTVANDSTFSSSYEVKPLDNPSVGTVLVTSIGKISIKGPGGIIVKTITKSVRTFAKSAAPQATVTDISAGSSTACAVADGWAYCWGSNANGQLGIGKNVTNNIQTTPTAVAKTAVAPGSGVCTAYDFFGNCYAWNPSPWSAQLANPMITKTVTKISVGPTHVCAIASGKAYCWGNNSSGQLGNNSTTSSPVPVAVNDTVGISALNGKTVTDITTGIDFTCALASDGQVACWGANANGQLGTNDTAASLVPKSVYKSDALPAVPTIPANPGVCDWYQWWGACGFYSVQPTPEIPGTPAQPATALFGKTVKKLARIESGTTMCVTDTDDNAYCWGENSSGQVGGQQYTQTRTVTTNSICAGGNPPYPPISAPAPSFADVLQPTAVQTTLKFDTMAVVGARVTAKTTSTSSTNPNRMYRWGGAVAVQTTPTTHPTHTLCGSTGGQSGGGVNKYITHSQATFSLTSYLPTTPLYDDPAGTDLNQKQLAITSGDASAGLFCAQTGSDIYCDPHTTSAQEGQTGNGTVVSCITEWWGGVTCTPTIPNTVQRVYMDGFLSGKTLQAMDTGDGYTCVVASGKLGCWGINDKGQVAIGSGVLPASCSSRGCFVPVPADVTGDLGASTGPSNNFDNPVSF